MELYRYENPDRNHYQLTELLKTVKKLLLGGAISGAKIERMTYFGDLGPWSCFGGRMGSTYLKKFKHFVITTVKARHAFPGIFFNVTTSEVSRPYTNISASLITDNGT